MFWRYLRGHLKNLILYLGFCGIFVIIFFLNNVSLGLIRYAFILAGAMIVIYTALNYLVFLSRHRRLAELASKIPIELDEFPEPANMIEADYQMIITQMFRRRQEIESKDAADYQDMMDYFTLWVHQIKTPITAMELMLQTREGEEDMKMELYQIEQYVDMVMSYLRTESDYTDYRFELYDLDPIIAEALKSCRTVFSLKKLSLSYQPVQKKVLTDKMWLIFVLRQILSNAIKYTEEGGIHIYLDESRSITTLVIADTGIGIIKEDLPRIFDKGFTGYNGRMGQKSSGLGLYLCRRIIDQLGHKLWIESQPGEGTQVCIEFTENSRMIRD